MSDAIWRALRDCPPSALPWAALAYRAAYPDAWQDGWDAAQRDMAISWHALYLHVQQTMRRPTFAELQARRREAG